MERLPPTSAIGFKRFVTRVSKVTKHQNCKHRLSRKSKDSHRNGYHHGNLQRKHDSPTRITPKFVPHRVGK